MKRYDAVGLKKAVRFWRNIIQKVQEWIFLWWIPPVFFTAPGVVGSPKSKDMLVSPRSEEALQ